MKVKISKKYSRRFSYSTYLLTVLALWLTSACHPQADNNKLEDEANPSNTWTYMGFGGGGAMFNPAISPHNPNDVFVSCDMTGSYVTQNGGESWRTFNLSGVVGAYTFDPIDSNVVYANSIALFKSIDRGKTWHVFYPDPANISGVVSKGDHAEEKIVTKDSTGRRVLSFAIDPTDSKKLYAAINIDSAVGFYTSANGGKQWTKERALEDGAKDIFIVPSSPSTDRTIYVTGTKTISVRQNGVWKVNRAPASVNKLTKFTGGFDSKTDNFVIYAISGKSYFNPEEEVSGIYYTDNGGETWENRQDGLANLRMQGTALPEWRTIATSALNPNIVYVSYNSLHANADSSYIGVAKSEDYGKNWALSWRDGISKGGNVISKNFTSGWINERFGPTWGENPFSIAVSPNDPNIVYATDFGRTVKTMNGGKTWEQVYTKRKSGAGWISRGLEVTTSYQVVFDPFDSEHVFISNTDIGLMESRDGGESWLSATQNNGIPRPWLNSTYWLTFDPDIKGKAWAAMSGTHDLPRPKMWRQDGISKYKGGIVITTDGGMSWEPISMDIGEAAITHVLIDPASPKESRTLLACAFGKGVYKSTDGGKSWALKNKGIEGDEPFAWRIIRKEKEGTLFLIVNRRSDDVGIGSDQDGAVYRSDNGAESWTKISLPKGTNGPTSLITDPNNADLLILSAWGRKTAGKFSPDIGGGIFLSKDDGQSWQQVLSKDQHIHDITYDPRIDTYYACGFNGSAYRSEDQGATWNRIKGYNFKWGKRVDLDPRDPERIFIITFGGGIWYGPAKGDMKDVEDIVWTGFKTN